MTVPQIIAAILGALIPILYGAVTGKFPEFPLDMANFDALFTWIIGLLVTGSAATLGYLTRRIKKADQRGEDVQIGNHFVRKTR